MSRCHEVNARQNRGHAQNKDTKNRKGDIDRGSQAIRRIECPPCIRWTPASENGDNDDNRSGDVKPPGQKVNSWKGNIPGADLNREKEISENRRNRWNDDKKDHDDPVQRKKRIICLRLHNGAWRKHLQSHKESENNSAEKEGHDEDEVKKPNPFVVQRENPGEDSAIFPVVLIKTDSWANALHRSG